MTIQEIMAAHKVSAFAGSDTACSCDRTWRPNAEYRKHLTEVLERHMQEREAEAWDRLVDYAPHTSYERKRLKAENPYRKDTTNGR